MAIICFDYGHGGRDPGAVYKDRREKDDNLDIGRLAAKSLRLHGVEVDETRRADETISLDARCRFENRKKYDYFISFHRNAYKPEEAKGAESYIHIKGSPKAEKLALMIQKALADQGFVDRGVKTDNFQVLRATLAPAVLIELGFIDNSLDNEIFVKNKNKISEAIVGAILNELGIKYKEPGKRMPDKENILYRVISGSFSVKENAEKRVKDLKQAGFESYLDIRK